MESLLAHPSRACARLRFSKKALAITAALLVLVSLLPLYAISFYNHPFYDDFGFSTRIHAVWKETGSFGKAVAMAWQNMCDTRYTWQGAYTGTFLSGVQPGVFSEKLYFFTTFLLLTAFLVCFAFFFKTVVMDLMHGDVWDWLLFSSGLFFLMVQFIPDPDEAFFWFNGGIGNTFIYSLLALSFALCVKLQKTQSAAKRGWLIVALLALMVLLGGGSYTGGLFGLLLYLLLCLWAFVSKSKSKWAFTSFFALFLGSFLFNALAPGNGVRAELIAYQSSAVKSILQSFYYGFALMANWTGLPLMAVTAALLPVVIPLAKKSTWRFAHPGWVLMLGLCLFCTQLTPCLYSGVYIGGGRTVDTYYYSFIVLWFLYAYYLAGHVVHRLRPETMRNAQEGFARREGAFVLLVVVALGFGCLGFKQSGDLSYGLPNMASGSALLSLVRGEAQTYDREMTRREALLNDETKPVVELSPLSVVPDVFMNDQLKIDAQYNIVPTLADYYHKEDIRIVPRKEGE